MQYIHVSRALCAPLRWRARLSHLAWRCRWGGQHGAAGTGPAWRCRDVRPRQAGERAVGRTRLVEETHTGHALAQDFGRRKPTIDEFGRQNQQLYQASFRAQFLSGIIQPSMQFLANLNYVAILGGY